MSLCRGRTNGLSDRRSESRHVVIALDPCQCRIPNSHPELAIAAQRIADGKIDADSFITATVGLDEAPWAFDALSRAEHAKIVVDPTR